jgi:hypothetical protein
MSDELEVVEQRDCGLKEILFQNLPGGTDNKAKKLNQDTRVFQSRFRATASPIQTQNISYFLSYLMTQSYGAKFTYSQPTSRKEIVVCVKVLSWLSLVKFEEKS